MSALSLFSGLGWGWEETPASYATKPKPKSPKAKKKARKAQKAARRKNRR